MLGSWNFNENASCELHSDSFVDISLVKVKHFIVKIQAFQNIYNVLKKQKVQGHYQNPAGFAGKTVVG